MKKWVERKIETKNLLDNPGHMAFVRSGIVYLDASAVWYVGRYAQLWSRTANSPNNAYDLFIYTDNVDPSAGGGRYVGRSLRCLYPGSA